MLYFNVLIVVISLIGIFFLIKYKYIKFKDLIDIVVGKLEKYYLYEAGSVKTKLAVTLIREQINKIWVLSWVTDEMIISLIKKSVDKYQEINGTTASRKLLADSLKIGLETNIKSVVKDVLDKNNVNEIVANQISNSIINDKIIKDTSKNIVIQATTDFKKSNILGIGINWKF